MSCWLNNMTIDDWATKNLTRIGRTKWDFQLMVGGFQMGDAQAARTVTGKAFIALDETPEGRDFKKATREIEAQGKRLENVLRREIRKT